ncbi:LOW QUALITY PROTEIN: hypothetical protein MKX08_007125 [Trichoderma sp. CBMAI-0020]|nr:LOW QUALITY PROTEIN: hypothetical protein MKX08_007125 [Trichoderma sp. CBMAI-0020]
MLQRNGYLSARLSPSNAVFAIASSFSAFAKSSGTSMVAGPAYAFSHRPSPFAASTSAIPAGFILPSNHLDALDVALRPKTAAAARREALQVELFVKGLPLAVDPAVAEGDVDGFQVADGGDLGEDGLFAEAQPDPGGG